MALVDAVHGEVVDLADSGRAVVAQLARTRAPLASAAVVDAVVERVLARTVGLGPLEPLLADAEVTEVMVNGPGTVWVERRGAVESTEVTLDRAAIELLVERIVAPLGLRADRTSPLVDARLPDGSRVNVIIPPLAIDGPCITIRRFGARTIPLSDMCPAEVALELAGAVRDRANIVVSGGTGAGKTTLLNALAAAIPDGERIVTVEDAAELRLPGRHVVRLEARPANADGVGAVTVRALVRNALRMRPDRIIVGEVRGAEALDMLQAMNTGHEGSLSTCHANSPVDALRRVETMVMMGDVGLPLGAIREQLVSALDLVVHVARRADGGRGIVAVAEVTSDSRRVRLLADEHRVVAKPERPPRR
jgi:pilus assembly protein CpaF